MKHRSSMPAALKSGIRRLLLVALLLLSLLLFHLHRFGCPRWLAEYALDRSSRGDFLVLAEAVRFSPFRGFALDHLRLFRKGVVGPPAIEADLAVVEIDLPAAIGKRPWVRRVRLSGGILRPDLAASTEKRPPARFDGAVPRLLELNDVQVDGLNIDRCRMNLKGSGYVLELGDVAADVSLENERGTLEGDFSFESRSALLRGDVEINCSPQVFLPIMEFHGMAAGVNIANRFRFQGAAPRAIVTFNRICRPAGRMNLSGSIWLQDFSYRGVDLLRLDSGIRMQFSGTNSVVALDRMVLVRPEGLARGSLSLDKSASGMTVTFDAVSSIEPRAAGMMTGVMTNLFRGTLLFEPPFDVVAHGNIHLGDRLRSRLESEWNCGSLRWGRFKAGNCSFKFRISGSTNIVEDVAATLCGGELSGSGAVVLAGSDSAPPSFRVRGRLSQADFEEFMRCISSDEGRAYRGRLSGEWDLKGTIGPDAAQRLAGSGAVRVKDGLVFMMPIFGGLSAQLSRAIPGLDFVMRQSDAKAKFTIGEGKVQSDRILIEGGVLSLLGAGDYYLDRRLDFVVQVSLFKAHTFMGKIVRIPTYLISKLFEFRLHGTLDEPEWRAVNFSEDLLNRLGLRDEQDDRTEHDEDGGTEAAPPAVKERAGGG